jgi:hypothetical protein
MACTVVGVGAAFGVRCASSKLQAWVPQRKWVWYPDTAPDCGRIDPPPTVVRPAPLLATGHWPLDSPPLDTSLSTPRMHSSSSIGFVSVNEKAACRQQTLAACHWYSADAVDLESGCAIHASQRRAHLAARADV